MIEICNSKGLNKVMSSLAYDERLTILEKLKIYNNINNIINSLFNFEYPESEKYSINFNKINEMKNDLLNKIYYIEGNDILSDLKLNYGIKISSYEYFYFIKYKNNDIAVNLCYLIDDDIGYFLIIPKSNPYYEEFISKLDKEYLYEFKEDI